MPYLRVIYRKKKYDFDYVPSGLLDFLIQDDEITHFYRPGEKKWIDVRMDVIRGRGGRYEGPERRRIDIKPKQGGQGTGSNAQDYHINWLEGLWRDIESL